MPDNFERFLAHERERRDLDLGGWDCEGQEGFDLDEPEPDDDLEPDPETGHEHPPARRIDDVHLEGDQL